MHDEAAHVLAFNVTRQGADRLRELVGASPHTRLAGMESNAEGFEQKALQMQPEILLLEYQPEKNGLYQLIERVRQLTPRSTVVALSSSKDPEAILKAMRLGVREYLTEPVVPSVFNEAMERLRNEASQRALSMGKIIAVMGVKGGVGTSSLALNLALALQKVSDEAVALVDLDLAGGDLAFLLDLETSCDLADVSRNFHRLDKAMLDSLVCEIQQGVKLMPAPSDPVAAEEVAPEHAVRAVEHLAERNGLVVLDLPSRLDAIAIEALDRSDLALLVTEPTLPGLKATRRMLALSDRLGHSPEKLAVVVNRMGAKAGLSKRQITDTLGRPVSAFLPEEVVRLTEAANAGVPLLAHRPRCSWAKTVKRLAQRVVEAAREEVQEAAA